MGKIIWPIKSAFKSGYQAGKYLSFISKYNQNISIPFAWFHSQTNQVKLLNDVLNFPCFVRERARFVRERLHIVRVLLQNHGRLLGI